MFTLIENGEIYKPEYGGKASVLMTQNQILKVGDVSRKALEEVGVEIDVVDASGETATPGKSWLPWRAPSRRAACAARSWRSC